MARLFLSPPHLSGDELGLLARRSSRTGSPRSARRSTRSRRSSLRPPGPHSVLALSSGTAALHLALVVNGIGAGDEVACSSLTFAASANPIVYSGAHPFFVDCDDSWLIDPSLLDEAIAARKREGGRVRAVIAVDLYGQVLRLRGDHRRVRAARRHPDPGRRRVPRRRPTAGAPRAPQAPLAALSFNGNKIITTSGGGALAGSDDAARRPRAEALDAGARAGAALRAHRDRLQLPPQQPPRRGRPRAARGAARARRGAAANQRPLPRAPRRRAGHRLHARRDRRHVELLAHVHHRRSRPRSAPTGSRSGSRSKQRTSRRARSGSRCTCSPCSRTARSTAATSPPACSSAASACRVARR